MTVEMRMKDGRKFIGSYAKVVDDTMVALHGVNKDPDPISNALVSDGPLIALVPVADVLEIVKVQNDPVAKLVETEQA